MTTEHKPHSELIAEIRRLLPPPKHNGNASLITDSQLTWVAERLDSLEEQLQTSEARLVEYEQRLGMGVISKDNELARLKEQLEAATNDASHLRLQLADAERDVSSLRSLRDDVERPAVLDTARFLAEHPENAGVSDAVKLARAYVGLYEQYENLIALRDDLTLKAYERGQEVERLKEQLEAEQRENQSAHARIAELDERLEASQNALRGLVAAIEGAHLMEFENGYGPFETALHEADRVLSNPASEPKEDA